MNLNVHQVLVGLPLGLRMFPQVWILPLIDSDMYNIFYTLVEPEESQN